MIRGEAAPVEAGSQANGFLYAVLRGGDGDDFGTGKEGFTVISGPEAVPFVAVYHLLLLCPVWALGRSPSFTIACSTDTSSYVPLQA